jgi:GLPGLI family protein
MFPFVIILALLSKPSHTPTNFPPKVEGKVKYIAEHSWTKQMKYLTYVSAQSKERMAYTWGNDDTWKNAHELYFTSTQSRYVDSEEKMNDWEWSNKKSTYTITRDFKNNKIKDHIELHDKKYIVEDDLKIPKWKMMSEMKEVAGHLCLKAITHDSIKGQKIVAWFAQDIPVSAGPERYCGLPGLILELDYNDGALVISASSVEFRTVTPEEISLPAKIKGKIVYKNDQRLY